jgi:hypothetical protein
MCSDLGLSGNLAARLRGFTLREDCPTLPPEVNDWRDAVWRSDSKKQIKFIYSHTYVDKILELFVEFIVISVGKHYLINLCYG